MWRDLTLSLANSGAELVGLVLLGVGLMIFKGVADLAQSWLGIKIEDEAVAKVDKALVDATNKLEKLLKERMKQEKAKSGITASSMTAVAESREGAQACADAMNQLEKDYPYLVATFGAEEIEVMIEDRVEKHISKLKFE